MSPYAFEPGIFSLAHMLPIQRSTVPAETRARLGTDALNDFDGKLMEGMIVELVDGPRLNYWVVLNNQLVQNSGVVEPTALKSTADTPEHLAGKLKFDDSKADGPKVDVDFDAPLLKTFTKAR